MKIEFDTTCHQVNEKIINMIRDEIIKLSHVNKDISRAEILLTEDATVIGKQNRACEIRLAVYGDDLFVHARTKSFEKSAKEAIKELKGLVAQQVARQKIPVDDIISTVGV